MRTSVLDKSKIFVSDQKLIRMAHNRTPRHTTVYTGLPMPDLSGRCFTKNRQQDNDTPNLHHRYAVPITPCAPEAVIQTDGFAARFQRLLVPLDQGHAPLRAA
jgi:hypothetical protein